MKNSKSSKHLAPNKQILPLEKILADMFGEEAFDCFNLTLTLLGYLR